MTLPEAEALFAQYVPNGTSNFTAECNDLLRRFFDSGKWNGLVTEYTLAYPVAGVVTLPDTYESVLAAQFDGNPVTLFSSYHEFQQGGPGEIEEGFSAVAGLVDNGDRTYKIVGGADYDEIRLKVKRRFVPLSADTDVLPIDNPAALKLGFMSLNYESNGQLELADQYFARALATLNGELKEARGGVQGVMQPSPHGFWPTNSKRGY